MVGLDTYVVFQYPPKKRVLLLTSWVLAKAKGGKKRQNEKGSYFW
jgi:hypothetical protein